MQLACFFSATMGPWLRLSATSQPGRGCSHPSLARLHCTPRLSALTLRAGDARRALAAAERLVLLCGDACPEERRDAAVLLLQAGQPHQVRPASLEDLGFPS